MTDYRTTPATTPDAAVDLLETFIRTGAEDVFDATLRYLATDDHDRVVDRMAACGNALSKPARAVTLLEHHGLITDEQFHAYGARVAKRMHPARGAAAG